MAKESKAMLKEAKQLFIDKDYNTTVKICKKVLKDDKTNYNALTLMAAAMFNIEDLKNQMTVQLKKATTIQPDNPVAWNGLVSYYEKQPDNIETWTELVHTYNNLLPLTSIPKKFSEYLKSLTSTLLKLKKDEALSESISMLCTLKSKKNCNEEIVKEINNELALILTQYPKLSNEYDEILEDVLSSIIQDENHLNRHEYYKKYLKLLYKREKYHELFSEAVKMHNIYNQDICHLEWLCRVYSEYYIIHEQCDDIDITIYYELLLAREPESILGYFSKGVYLYKTQNFIDARNILSHLADIKPKWFHVWLLLCKIDVILYCWEDCESAALHALNLIPEEDPYKLRPYIKLNLLESLIKCSNKLKWKKAEAQFDELSDDSLKSTVLRAHLYVQLRDARAKDLINDLKNNPKTEIEATILHAMDLLYEKCLQEAADVLGSVLGSSEAWLLLGKIHWEMFDFGHSLMAFLNALNANTYNWESLVYLGRYYQEYAKDYERSRKCYRKALQINPNSEQAGIGLSSVYKLLDDVEANIEFLKQLTSQGKGPKWALLQLGIQQLDLNNALEAVTVFRNAVKADPGDSNCWECLADAYLERGAYISASKSYERALEINPDSFYSKTQLSRINLLIGEYAKAKDEFSCILKEDEKNVSALIGIAMCCFMLGQKYAKMQLLARARDYFQESVDNITKAAILQSDFTCIWKQLGDVCYNVADLPEKYCFLNVVQELIQPDSHGDNVTIKLKEILLLSKRCYLRALSISKKSSLLWHDLACCFLAQAKFDKSVDRNEVINHSLAAAKEAVKLNPTYWFHWNLLGVICMSEELKNYALAQHSFLMAIERETNNAVPWTNLGTLFLILGNLHRANEAFSWAQRGNPEYVNCWIGQAYIAEIIQPQEVLDLLRHCTQLNYHHEGAIGYANWVLKTIMNPEAKKEPLFNYIIEKMHAVTVATDSIHWYTVHFPCDPNGLNIYGLLLERQKLYKPSAEQFTNALKYAENDKQRDQININLARIMVRLGRYEEAVKVCMCIKETSFVSHCQLALSLFKAEHYKESYDAYDAALHQLTDVASEKAHVLCAMAAMAYMFQESNDAKTLLYESIQIQPPVVSGLLALAAIGMLDGDKNLTHLVLKELKLHANHQEYKNDIAKVTAYSYLIQNDMEGASRIFCKYIHCYPDSSELWTNLARILLMMSDLSFKKCVDKALFLGGKMSNEHVAKITCMSSLSTLITSSPKEGLRSVLNTVHSYPACADSWANLITALIPRWSKISQFNAHWLMVLVSRIRNDLTCTRNMEQWLLKNEKRATDIAYG